MDLPFAGDAVDFFVAGFLSIAAIRRIRVGEDSISPDRHPDVKVASFQDQIGYEVGIIAHSCGLLEPRQLRRFHCRVVQDKGNSVPLDQIYPDKTAQDLIQP